MSSLKLHLLQVKRFTPDRVARDLMNILKEEEEVATGMISDQLFQGEDSSGKNLPEYSPASVNIFGKPAGSWRLFDSGAFHRGIFMEVTKDKAVFDDSDDKRDLIFEKLELKGEDPNDLLGLNKENRRDLAQSYLKEKTAAYFRKVLAI